MNYDLDNEFASISAYNYGDEEIMDDEKEYWRKRVQEEGEVVLDEDTWKTVEAAIQASERGEVIGPFDNIEDALNPQKY